MIVAFVITVFMVIWFCSGIVAGEPHDELY